MFLPLHDGAPLRFLRRPVVTYLLILSNVAIYLTVSQGLLGDPERIDLALGAIPAVLLDHASLEKGLALVPAPLTPITSQFLHAGFGHLAGNMLFLWVFGDNVEDAFGSLRYFAFYLACGVAGTLAFALADPTSEAPLIGASGGISGVVVAYLLLYPRLRVFGLAFNLVPLRLPAVWFLGAWIAVQILSALASEHSEVAFWAHVGGIACGAALTPLLRRAAAPLFSERTA